MDTYRRIFQFHATKTHYYRTDFTIRWAFFVTFPAICIWHNLFPCRAFMRRNMNALVTHLMVRKEIIARFRSFITAPKTKPIYEALKNNVSIKQTVAPTIHIGGWCE